MAEEIWSSFTTRASFDTAGVKNNSKFVDQMKVLGVTDVEAYINKRIALISNSLHMDYGKHQELRKRKETIMKIWEIKNKADNIEFDCTEEEFEKVSIYSWKEDSIVQKWDSSFTCFVVDKKKEETNMPFFGGMFLIVDEIALSVLEEIAQGKFESLEFTCEEKKYYIIHITNVLDCVDMENSKYKPAKNDPSIILTYEKLYFVKEKVAGAHLFRSYQYPSGFFLCSDELKNAIEKKNITGVEFKLVQDFTE